MWENSIKISALATVPRRQFNGHPSGDMSLGEGKRYRYRFGSHWHVERIQKHGQIRSLQESVLIEGELRTKFWFPYLEVRELKRQPATVTRNVTCSWPVKEKGTQGETGHPVILHVTLPTTLVGGCDR